MTALQGAVDIVGGQSALARVLGVRQAHVWNWLHRGKGRVPAEYVRAISDATGGKVSCHDLRPDVFDRVVGSAA